MMGRRKNSADIFADTRILQMVNSRTKCNFD
jgi:hypothetical protein